MAKFRTRARAIDMLGRQQIAGVPTAIAELFKNAHDAYADRVEVDYFALDNLLVLRDDGLGMTRGDFEDRWLVLGTESKLGGSHGVKRPPQDRTKPPRPILGEKGIGRLAIALLGPQALVLTRAAYGQKRRDIVACFINWDLFELPGINLDEIEIPLEVFSGEEVPTAAAIGRLVGATRQTLAGLRPNMDAESYSRVRGQLDQFAVDPRTLLEGLGEPTLAGHHSGTHFYIQPATHLIRRDLDLDLEYRSGQKVDQICDLRRHLLGFVDTMIPGAAAPRIRTAFRYWKTNEAPLTDLIEDREFFTPEEFLDADHRIRGEFDETGFWRGTVEIYDQAPIQHTIAPPRGMSQQTECGSFRIDFAYVQGEARHSRLPAAEWNRMDAKLKRLGGLYVYRDDIRVSPYGDTREDFLDIEERRSRGAGHYFFSHRRMFGAVSITRLGNPELKDKAGREGLQKNSAYATFHELLVNLYVQLAATFFREGKDEPSLWEQLRAQLLEAETARREREKRTRLARRQFNADLKRVLAAMEGGEVDAAAQAIASTLQSTASELGDEEPGPAMDSLHSMEAQASRDLRALRRTLHVERPAELGLSREEARRWARYQMMLAQADEGVFSKAEALVGELVRTRAGELQLCIDARERARALAAEALSDARDLLRAGTEAVSTEVDRIAEAVREITADAFTALESEEEKLSARLEQQADADPDMAHLDSVRSEVTQSLLSQSERQLDVLERIRQQLEAVRWTKTEAGKLTTALDETAAMETELIGLRIRVDEDLELAQLGMAIEVIDHEFSSAVTGIRDNLKQLRKWGRKNEAFTRLVESVVGNFAHLDGYLRLFTPLYRRVHRQALAISGQEILNYLHQLFGQRLAASETVLVATDGFLAATTVTYPSTLYPVFINLVDNALFWLSERQPPRTITLDADGRALLVSDNGPGLHPEDGEAIFERGFTRKPGGRGLGLFISREALAREKGSLTLELSAPGQGACFRIDPPSAGGNA